MTTEEKLELYIFLKAINIRMCKKPFLQSL